MRVALVNTNLVQPPIAPIGIDYVAEALHAAGHEPRILDLCWETDWEGAMAAFFARDSYDLVGLSLRNTDDCMYPSRASFLPQFGAMAAAARGHTDGAMVIGGCGFSILPEQVLGLCEADAGVWAEGEFCLPEVATRIERGEAWNDVSGLITRRGPSAGGRASWERVPPVRRSLDELPVMTRTWVDNVRYFERGGQIGFETRRGCPGQCTYCADPIAKGSHTRLRPPEAVADELELLVGRGIDHFHTCDPEFNIPASHAVAVCEELARRGLGERSRWYAYCAPTPFPPELAQTMREAGCAGVNFGTDSGDAGMLQRLRRTHTTDDIRRATRWCREAGQAVMLDLLLGSPGETEDSMRSTIELMKEIEPDRVGVALGVRVYPGTEVARQVSAGDGRGCIGGADASDPLFFIDPAVGEGAAEMVAELIQGDERFFFESPSAREAEREPEGAEANVSYNYNANQPLVEALASGYRGAFWDILRRVAEEGKA